MALQSLLAAKKIVSVILNFFHTIIFGKSVQLVGSTARLCLAVRKGTHTMLRVGLFHLQFQSVWVPVPCCLPVLGKLPRFSFQGHLELILDLQP